eukprot:g15912.t1
MNSPRRVVRGLLLRSFCVAAAEVVRLCDVQRPVYAVEQATSYEVRSLYYEDDAYSDRVRGMILLSAFLRRTPEKMKQNRKTPRVRCMLTMGFYYDADSDRCSVQAPDGVVAPKSRRCSKALYSEENSCRLSACKAGYAYENYRSLEQVLQLRMARMAREAELLGEERKSMERQEKLEDMQRCFVECQKKVFENRLKTCREADNRITIGDVLEVAAEGNGESNSNQDEGLYYLEGDPTKFPLHGSRPSVIRGWPIPATTLGVFKQGVSLLRAARRAGVGGKSIHRKETGGEEVAGVHLVGDRKFLNAEQAAFLQHFFLQESGFDRSRADTVRHACSSSGFGGSFFTDSGIPWHASEVAHGRGRASYPGLVSPCTRKVVLDRSDMSRTANMFVLDQVANFYYGPYTRARAWWEDTARPFLADKLEDFSERVEEAGGLRAALWDSCCAVGRGLLENCPRRCARGLAGMATRGLTAPKTLQPAKLLRSVADRGREQLQALPGTVRCAAGRLWDLYEKKQHGLYEENSGSDKTQLALDAALELLIGSPTAAVFWFFTKGRRIGFPLHRAVTIKVLIVFDAISDLDFAEKPHLAKRSQQLFQLAPWLKKLEWAGTTRGRAAADTNDSTIELHDLQEKEEEGRGPGDHRDEGTKSCVLVLSGVVNDSAGDLFADDEEEVHGTDEPPSAPANPSALSAGKNVKKNHTPSTRVTKPALGLPWSYCFQDHISLWKRGDRAAFHPMRTGLFAMSREAGVAAAGRLWFLERSSMMGPDYGFFAVGSAGVAFEVGGGAGAVDHGGTGLKTHFCDNSEKMQDEHEVSYDIKIGDRLSFLRFF